MRRANSSSVLCPLARPHTPCFKRHNDSPLVKRCLFQIYLFRGAVNALGSVESTHTFYLTQSFRFGPEIAFAADAFLTTQKGVETQTLVGGNKRDFVVSRSVIDVTNKEFRPVAVIGRTNMELFAEVVRLVCDVKDDVRPRAAFAGGFESYNFNDYLDIYNLSIGRNELMKKWKNFRSFSSFQQFAQNTNDPELLTKLECVRVYGQRFDARFIFRLVCGMLDL